MNNLYIIASVVIIIIYYFSTTITEKFTVYDPLIDNIYEHLIQNDTDFEAYLKVLSDNNNMNLKMIDLNNYYEFKTLKNLNLLTKDKINAKFN